MLHFGQLGQNSTGNPEDAKTALLELSLWNSKQQPEDHTIVFYQNFGSKIAKYYDMGKLSWAASNTR